jgi:hypothetical protein
MGVAAPMPHRIQEGLLRGSRPQHQRHLRALGDDDELRLHRDEVHLRKSGAISLGQAIGLNQQDIVYFQCSY